MYRCLAIVPVATLFSIFTLQVRKYLSFYARLWLLLRPNPGIPAVVTLNIATLLFPVNSLRIVLLIAIFPSTICCMFVLWGFIQTVIGSYQIAHYVAKLGTQRFVTQCHGRTVKIVIKARYRKFAYDVATEEHG